NGKVYDCEETIKNIKETIIDVRRDGSWSKEQARKEWDLLDSDLEYEYGFYRWQDRTKFDDAYDLARYAYPASALAFAKKLMPRLAEVLKRELGKAA
ncbi:MAG: hypothetical protein ACYCX4_06995, partial [Bacillota bacterium]